MLDISDVVEGDAGIFDEQGEALSDLKAARELEDLEKVRILASLLSTMVDMQMTQSKCSQSSEESRVRAWYTSVMIATAYVQPETVLTNDYVIKGRPQRGGQPRHCPAT